VVTDKQQDMTDRRSARRRLIKGSFAVPATVTLCSGSAFAAASNKRCVANAAADPQTPDAIATDDAVWVRLQAYYDAPTGGNAWIVGSEVAGLAAFAGTHSLLMTVSEALCVVSATKSIVAGTVHAVPSSLNSLTLLQSAPKGKYYAVLVNSGGDIVGISQSIGTGGAVHRSCWTSFHAA
jgi:hypothetical protein